MDNKIINKSKGIFITDVCNNNTQNINIRDKYVLSVFIAMFQTSSVCLLYVTFKFIKHHLPGSVA